ncbi:MAG: NAD(P)/FAD-dependent oxidoreductase [Chloroflexota bacterium]
MSDGIVRAAEDVLVIGAGPAGLTAAYYLERAGISYRIVERERIIGSTWANLYPTLRLNTANFVSSLVGMPIPWRGGFYMTGRQFYRYLCEFAERNNFRIDFGVEVLRVAPEAGGWRVETTAGAAWYPCVILATGKFGNPIMPPVPGLDAFTGRLLHARDFHDPADFRGQRVLVVGNGPSGVDIATALAGVAASPVYLAIRSDIVVARRYPFGLPETLWRVLLQPLPERIRKPLQDFICYQSYPGLRKHNLPLAPNRTNRKGTGAPARGPELLRALDAGTLKAVAGLERLESDAAVLMDGTRLQVDAVIMATGYRPVVHFLDMPFETDNDGWPVRDEGQEVAGYPGLYIVGRFYQGFGPLYNMKIEARLAVSQIQRRLANLAQDTSRASSERSLSADSTPAS